jgi:hypothetical protein
MDLKRIRGVGAGTVMMLAGGAVAAAVPTQQQAVVQHGYGGPEVLKVQSIPVLQAGAGQVLIEVYAAAVNPVDCQGRER